MNYLKEQGKSFEIEIRKSEEDHKMLEDESIKIEEKKKIKDERIRNINQMHPYINSFSYKDTELKTFYFDEIQTPYKVADLPFPKRNTKTLSFKTEESNENLSTNFNTFINMNEVKITDITNSNYKLNVVDFNNNSTNFMCPGCGKILVQQKQQINNLVFIGSPLCPGCGRFLMQSC